MATNGFVAGGDMLKVSVGFVGVRETLVKLAPPPFPISPFFPPQPPRAIMAEVIVNRIERLSIQGSCERDKIPAFKLTSRCSRFTTFLIPSPRPAASLSWLRESSGP